MRRGRGTHVEGLLQHGCWRQRLTYGVLGAPWHFLSWTRKWKRHHQNNRGKRSRQITKQSDSNCLDTSNRVAARTLSFGGLRSGQISSAEAFIIAGIKKEMTKKCLSRKQQAPQSRSSIVSLALDKSRVTLAAGV